MEYGKAELRHFFNTFVFIGTIGALFILNLLSPSPEVLASERRKPAKFPELSISTIASAGFMNKFEGYAADNFAFRDSFRALRAFTVLDVLRMTDKSGIYRSKNVGVGEFRRVDAKAYAQSAEKIKTVADSLRAGGTNVYFTFVPDKSAYAERYMPGFDPQLAEDTLLGILGGINYIKLAGSDALGAGSFYRTDLHWDQPEIFEVAELICQALGAVPDLGGYSKKNAGDFRGVYPGQLALPVPADSLFYMDLSTLKASYLSEKTLQFEQSPVYDPQRAGGIDPYDLFLQGPQPLIILENEAAPEKELYLFRDSFGSSLAPFLAGAYSKITLIDLRYINWKILNQLIRFEPGADALFIYSSQIFNNPSVLQV